MSSNFVFLLKIDGCASFLHMLANAIFLSILIFLTLKFKKLILIVVYFTFILRVRLSLSVCVSRLFVFSLIYSVFCPFLYRIMKFLLIWKSFMPISKLALYL